jgi:hypothetical protein
MEINRGNYEAYFLDYFENRLEPQRVAELMVFLQENPDLNDAFESYDPLILEPEPIPFAMKEGLKKQNYTPAGEIDAFNYDHWMVADLEGDLTEDQKKELHVFLFQNPNARLEYALYKKTKLTPGPEVFENKDDLKKSTLFVAYRTQWISAIAVAASLLLFIGLYFGNRYRYQEDPGPGNIQVTESARIEAPMLQPEGNVPQEITPRFVHQRNAVSEGITLTDVHAHTVNRSANARMMKLDPRNVTQIAVPSLERRTAAERHTKFAIFLTQEVKPEENRPGFVGRFMQGLFKKTIPKMDQKSFLEYTLDGYNFMSDRDVELEKQYDETGKVVAYRINGENIRIGQKVQPPLKD